MTDSNPQFSPKQIAGSLKVSESSVKRWCDQGIIPTVRTVGGHRRITLAGLEKFLAETDRVLANPEALGLDGDIPRGRPLRIEGGKEPDQRQFRNALAEGNKAACIELIDGRIRQGWKISEIGEDLVADAMRGIGEAWECGRLDVYQERRGCDICVELIYYLRGKLDRPADTAPIAIGCSPETDPYQLPTHLVELALLESGFRAVSLGNNLPVDSMIQAAMDYRPQLFWLSVSWVEDVEHFVSEQNRLASSLGDEVPLLLGGQALTDDLRPRLKYSAYCDTLRHLSELASMIRRS